MTNKFTFSIVMCTAGKNEHIIDSINSVLNQSYKNFEFIIICDGDPSNKIKRCLDSIKLKDARVKVFNKKHSGLTDSLNYGVSKTQNLWIARIDDDDIWYRNKLKLQYQLLINNKPNVALVGTNFCLFYNINDISYKKKVRVIFPFLNILFFGTFFPHSSIVFNKNKFLKVGGYRVFFKRSQDNDLWLRMSRVGKIIYSKDILTEIKIHKNQISRKLGQVDQFWFSRVALVDYLLTRSKKFQENDIKGKVYNDLKSNNFLRKVLIIFLKYNKDDYFNKFNKTYLYKLKNIIFKVFYRIFSFFICYFLYWRIRIFYRIF